MRRRRRVGRKCGGRGENTGEGNIKILRIKGCSLDLSRSIAGQVP
jgi:hypothetical protein